MYAYRDCGKELQDDEGHADCWQRPATSAPPPQTVLARVWLDLRGPDGPYSSAQVEAALRQAMIPPHAPYREWEAMIGRSLTLLPRIEGTP